MAAESRFALVDLGADQVGELARRLARLAPVEVSDGHATEFTGARAVILPGRAPISAADAERLAGSPALEALARFAAGGGAVLAIGSGVQVLCARGLLCGSFADSPAVEGAVHCLVEGRPSPFTWALPVGRCLTMGQVTPPQSYCCADLSTIEDQGRVVLRFCSPDGGTERDGPVVGRVAGVCNRNGNVVGLIPQLGVGGIALMRSVLAERRGRSSRIPL